jgi:hypothetical protein
MEEDFNIFENGRRPQLFSNGRLPKICSRQPKELIFGMQPYFNPSRWYMVEVLNIFEIWRWPEFFSSNGRRLQFCSRQPRKLIFGMQHCYNPTRWQLPYYFSIFLKMEVDLNFFNWKTTSIFINKSQPTLFWLNGKQPQYSFEWKMTYKIKNKQCNQCNLKQIS